MSVTRRDGNVPPPTNSMTSVTSTGSPRDDYSFDIPVQKRSWAYNLLTAYTVPKTVTIRSASLKIPYLVMIFLLGVFIILYTLIYKLGFMTQVTAYGMATIEAIPPLENFWDCEDIDVDCQRQAVPKLEKYCHKAGGKVRPEEFEGCEDVDFFSITPSSTAESAVVPTSMLELEQVQKPFERGSTIWKTEDTKVMYVPNPERWLLKIRHSFQSEACTGGCNSDETQGFIHFADEIRRMGSCADLNIKSSGCLSDIEMAEAWKETKLCGSGESGSLDMCMSTSWGDYITIGTLLKAANASLDDLTLDGSMTRREGGLAIILEIHYVNDVVSEYWSAPVGTKWKYTYRVRVIQEAGDSDHVVSRTIESVSKDGTKRTARKYLGLTIRPELTSSMKTPSLFHALVAIALSASILSVSNIVVEKIILKLYLCTSYGQSLVAMFTYFSHDESLDLQKFATLHSQGKMGEAKQQAEVSHAELLEQHVNVATGSPAKKPC